MTTIDLQVVKKDVGGIRGSHSYQLAGIETVELFSTPEGGTSNKTTPKLGIQLMGGPNVTRNGEPGIFVENVKLGSVAEGKLFPGDKIIAINDVFLGKVSLKYAMEAMHSMKRAEGRLTMSVKRAQLREQRVNEAFSMYCEDEDTEKPAVFNKAQVEVFEEAFSMFETNGFGVIHYKHVFPLLRDLGYNVHKAEAWYYMNKLELSEKRMITLSEVIKLLEEVATERKELNEVPSVYNVFDPDQKGRVALYEIHDALSLMYGQKITEDEVSRILSIADEENTGFCREQDFERLLLPSLKLY